MSLEPIVKSGDQAIYIRVVIDTDSLPLSAASRGNTQTPITILCEQSTVVPQSLTSVLPPRIVDEEFWFYQASVITKGTENYNVQFALYTRSATTGNPELFSAI